MTSAFLQLSPIPKGIGHFIEGSAKRVINAGAKSNHISHPREVALIEARRACGTRVCGAKKIVSRYAVRLSASFGFCLRACEIGLMWTDRYNRVARVGPRKYLGKHRMSTVERIDGIPTSRSMSISLWAASKAISRRVPADREKYLLRTIDIIEGRQR